MARRRRRNQPAEPVALRIDAMSHEGRGIANINGKTVFVFGALKGELVKAQIKKTSQKFDQATTIEVLEPATQRVQPRCEAFERCGGCSLQYLDNDDQLAFKQQTMIDMMQHAGLEPAQILPALRSRPWGYRRKARLGVKYVRKKGRVLVGFRERNAAFLADMSSCEVLIPEVGHRLQELAALIEQLDARESIPQIEVAADDNCVILLFRHLQQLSESDQQKLTDFARDTGFNLQLQPKGPDSIRNLFPERQSLQFSPLPEDNIKIDFSAVDFVQVNNDINQQMVMQALKFLQLDPDDRVLDLFCGLGNFTLPMARRCERVTGVEGDIAMVQRAKHSALANNIENTKYYSADLTQIDNDWPWMRQKFDKILLDPPRCGAMEIAGQIKRFEANIIVYVSCQPASLVRDSKIICDNGYRLTHFGVMDMFPQTAHVESMAVFTRR
ncbi:MAG: 23S rRNA (uracil(1939)-C(5))-methyltransferase RlmD [Gammaproteobacteria bacterium]|nr:23S rRNA (uracil(1939)-C(5))-methyltransferase RlmD [Gammaproteobacteria bacterium]